MKEGFGSDEFLTKTEKKKFEKERLERFLEDTEKKLYIRGCKKKI